MGGDVTALSFALASENAALHQRLTTAREATHRERQVDLIWVYSNQTG